MRRILPVVLATICLTQAVRAQERKIEISPFAGGYFSTGYQSYRSIGNISGLGPPATGGEPKSGIFGVRASHNLTSSLSLECTFGFSPTGLRFRREGWSFSSIEAFLTGSGPPPDRAGETYHYAGNILYELYNRVGWAPFFTAGAGAVTRTGREPTTTPVISPYLALSPVSQPSTQTNLSVNLGGGVKKYFTDRYGIRFDFRSYISQPSGDTVNNIQVSLGLIFKL